MLGALYHAQSPEGFLCLCENLHNKGCRGILLTGGCEPDGAIPLVEFAEAAGEARRRWGLRFAAHTKLATPDFARAAAEIGVDPLMLDIVGDDETLRGVYHLRDRSVADVEASLDLAEGLGLPLAPHILAGLAWGQVKGEYRAIEMLKGHAAAVKALALVVLTPLRETPMAACRVDIPAVLDVMSAARREFPGVFLTLGCAKTGGRTQRRLEEHALALGFNAIAYPSEGIVACAREMGFDVRFSEDCCALALASEDFSRQNEN